VDEVTRVDLVSQLEAVLDASTLAKVDDAGQRVVQQSS
jgi:hypothetical protein